MAEDGLNAQETIALSEALTKDRERIISKIEATFSNEIDKKWIKIKPKERLDHILTMIYFNIRNPDYARKDKV